jgi:hypothetical protein
MPDRADGAEYDSCVILALPFDAELIDNASMAKMTRMPVSEGFGLMYAAGRFPSRRVPSGDVDRPVKRPQQLPPPNEV